MCKFIAFIVIEIFFYPVFLYAQNHSLHTFYSYDNNGNMILIKKQKSELTFVNTYRYNTSNQMVSYVDGQSQRTYTYAYYPNGSRLSKSINSSNLSESIRFLYGHKNQLINEEYSRNNKLQKRSTYFAGIRLISGVLDINENTLQYLINDRLNSPVAVNLSYNSNKMQSNHLSDYGVLEQTTIIDGSVNKVSEYIGFNFDLNPKIYGTAYYDVESDLQYMGARYYSASTQRFIAQDSYNLLNRYSYAEDNPVMNYDPSGHASVGDYTKGMLKEFTPHDKNSWIIFGVVTALTMTTGIVGGVAKISEGAVISSERRGLTYAFRRAILNPRSIASEEPGIPLTDFSETASIDTLLASDASSSTSTFSGLSNVRSTSDFKEYTAGLLSQDNYRHIQYRARLRTNFSEKGLYYLDVISRSKNKNLLTSLKFRSDKVSLVTEFRSIRRYIANIFGDGYINDMKDSSFELMEYNEIMNSNKMVYIDLDTTQTELKSQENKTYPFKRTFSFPVKRLIGASST